MGGSIGPSFDKHEPPLVISISKEIVLQVSFVLSGRLDNGSQISAELVFPSFPRIENRNHEQIGHDASSVYRTLRHRMTPISVKALKAIPESLRPGGSAVPRRHLSTSPHSVRS
jgi:hypothetical protein